MMTLTYCTLLMLSSGYGGWLWRVIDDDNATWNNHGLPNGAQVIFTTTGALPTGLKVGAMYYVRKAATKFTAAQFFGCVVVAIFAISMLVIRGECNG